MPSLSISYSSEHFPELDGRLREATDLEIGDSGMGFGSRDIEFEVTGKTQAKKLAAKIKSKKLPITSMCFTDYVDLLGEEEY